MATMLRLLVLVAVFFHVHSANAECIGNKGKQKLLPAATFYSISASCFTDKGWFPPVPASEGQLRTKTDYDYESLTYTANNQVTFTHGGIDFIGTDAARYTTATPVYSIGHGKVSYIDRREGGQNLSVVVVEYESGNGQKFSGLYGHTYADPELLVGQYVIRGQRLGTLRLYGSPMHLHFSVYPDYTWPAGGTWGGNGATREPMQFLRDNYGTLIPRSQLDGVGSLIDPLNGGTCGVSPINGFGCNMDEARLHARVFPSAAVFQIHSESNAGCDYVTVSGLTRAFVGVRMWNESYPASSGGSLSVKSIFLAEQFPANIKIPPGFSLLSISTTQPIPPGEVRNVRVKCMAGTAPTPAGITSIASDDAGVRYANQMPLMLHLTEGVVSRFFGGNGSLIEPSNNLRTSGFGRSRDYAKTQATGYSEVFFQAYATSVCSRVVLSTNQGSPSARVATKSWNSSSWLDIGLLGLPATISLPTNSYQIIRVRPSSAASGRITATCQ